MVFLPLAGALAVSSKAQNIAYAAHAGDHTIYPDCRVSFIQAMRDAFKLCDWHPIELIAPFDSQTKGEIVKCGTELAVPYGITWSCYEGGQLHCGKCGTCVERKEAFQLAKVKDPTQYFA
jgi:7-cyano-7-deazaguanine synthase